MHTQLRVVAVISLFALSPVARAQWPLYPTPAVPKTGAGQPDLTAPTPRTPDGKPDFTGLWEFVPVARPNPATPPPGSDTSAGLGPTRPGPNQFFNIGSTLPDGLPFQPWAAELRKQRTAANNKDNPDAHCLPIGLMQLHTHPQPRKIIQTAGLMVILYEAQGGIRQIFTDGRPLPHNDPQPWWYGYSTAHWDGDTLVVETNGFRDDVWLDVEGSPLTNSGKMTERFRRLNYGNLEIEVTVDDPKVYTKPWTVTIKQKIMLNTDLIEFVCQENERDALHLVEPPKAAAQSGAAKNAVTTQAIDLNATLPLDQLAAQLAKKRVVFVGENHDRYDHHLNQLELIRRLHESDPNIAIGVEYFQQPFQAQVDDYIAGKTSEHEFLKATEYFERWGYDYRLYAPIFRYAREQHIPVRALNVPGDVVSAVAKAGVAGLSAAQRAYLPKEMGPADEGYKNRLRQAFESHKDKNAGAFDHFVEAQLTWDEGMALSAANYLAANPGRRMVILAGSGHLMFGSGIPRRLERQTGASFAIVLNSVDEVEPHIADYLLPSEKKDLPPAGVLGVSLEEKNGESRIKAVSPGSAAEKAGLKKGEAITEVDGQVVKTTADLRLILWQSKPGDHVRIATKRGAVDVTLSTAAPR